MTLTDFAPWSVLLAYAIAVLWITPRRVTPAQFYNGASNLGTAPGPLLLGVSAAIAWVMAKSVDNTMNMTGAFGIWGGIGYATYWFSFVTAGVAIYFIRTRGGYVSLPEFLTKRYGAFAAKSFLIVVIIRLFNEVWSNTKVTSQFFGPEGSLPYWIAALAVTGFVIFYTWRGGLRASILSDAMQMALFAILITVVLVTLFPPLLKAGLPTVANGVVTPDMQAGGLTFLALALVQTLSYPFHDPVLTDRAFVSPPRSMVRAFVVAAFVGGGAIALFSVPGLYALAFKVSLKPSVAVTVPAAIGLWLSLVFNGVMLVSAGSTLDSTFSSSAKFGARDWPGRHGAADARQVSVGRRVMLLIAVLGNIPLLGVYFAGIGPAVIAATTISGTAVMGLAPIFLLWWVRRAGALSFHLAFWPGVLLGIVMVVETTSGWKLVPEWVSIGSGKYAQTLGLNVYGSLLATAGYLLGAVISPVKR